MNPAELFRQESDALQLAAGDFFSGRRNGDKMYVLLEGEIEISLGANISRPQGPAC